MTTRRKQTLDASALAILAVLFLALTMLANVALRGLRLDLTENGLYSLSDGTRHLLGSLREPINLYFYFSNEDTADIPSLRSYAQRVQELLEEFVLRSNGKLRLQVIDPLRFSEAEDDAARFGLQPIPVGQTADSIYFGLAGTNPIDQQEVIPFFDPNKEAFLEYDVARLVYALDNPKHPVIGLLSSLPMQGGFDFNTQQTREGWAVVTQMEELFEVRALEPGLTKIDDDISLLMLVHPKELGDATLYAIDQFVLRGGKALVFVDPYAEADTPPQDPSNPAAAMMAPRSSNLARLFEAWGVQYDPDEVVLDPRLALNVGGRRGQAVRHLAFLGLDANSFDRSDVVTSGLNSINLGLAGHLAQKEGASTTLTPLLSASDQSSTTGVERFRFLADPATLMDDYAPGGKPLILAARVQGKVKSAFPGGYTEPEPGADPEAAAEKDAPGPHIEESAGDVNLVVVADTDLLTDRLWVQVQNFFGQQLLSAFANNGDFVVNALDNLAGSSDLIGIRGRATYTRPFERVEELRRRADADFRATEQALQDQLSETERKLTELQSQRQEGEDVTILSDAQRQEIQRFQAEKLRIRKELRQVRRNLLSDIDRLGATLQVINVLLVPALVALAALGVFMARARRRAST